MELPLLSRLTKLSPQGADKICGRLVERVRVGQLREQVGAKVIENGEQELFFRLEVSQERRMRNT